MVVCYSLVGQLGLGLEYTWGGGDLGVVIIEIGKWMHVQLRLLCGGGTAMQIGVFVLGIDQW